MHDPEMQKMVRKLIEEVLSKEECLRLGFLGKDDNETLFITPLGAAFLFGVVVPEINSSPKPPRLNGGRAARQDSGKAGSRNAPRSATGFCAGVSP